MSNPVRRVISGTKGSPPFGGFFHRGGQTNSRLKLAERHFVCDVSRAFYPVCVFLIFCFFFHFFLFFWNKKLRRWEIQLNDNHVRVLRIRVPRRWYRILRTFVQHRKITRSAVQCVTMWQSRDRFYAVSFIRAYRITLSRNRVTSYRVRVARCVTRLIFSIFVWKLSVFVDSFHRIINFAPFMEIFPILCTLNSRFFWNFIAILFVRRRYLFRQVLWGSMRLVEICIVAHGRVRALLKY